MEEIDHRNTRPELIRQGTKAVGAGAVAGAVFGAIVGAMSGALAGAFLFSATAVSREAIRRYRERRREEEDGYDEEM